jgi:hypothetical protein
MVCDNLCSTQHRKSAVSQKSTDSSPPPPYSKNDKSNKSDSKGGETDKRQKERTQCFSMNAIVGASLPTRGTVLSTPIVSALHYIAGSRRTFTLANVYCSDEHGTPQCRIWATAMVQNS